MQKQTSLSEVSQSAQVRPLVIISKECLQVECINDILHSTLNLFIAYYLQAVSLMTVVNSVKVIRILDQFNPDRTLSTWLLTQENYDDSDSLKSRLMDDTSLMAAAYRYALPMVTNERSFSAAKEELALSLEDKQQSGKTPPMPVTAVTDQANLAVGKLVNVTISSIKTSSDHNGEEKVVIPVLFQLVPASLLSAPIVHLLISKSEDVSFFERWHQWRAGRIRFIKDLIFCQDLIDEHKKALMKDTDGAYTEIHRRGGNSKMLGLITDKPSLASASNIFVISEEVAKTLEMRVGGKLSSTHIRDRIFESTYAMILVVVDRHYDRVTIYIRGQAFPSELSYSQIKVIGKSKEGPDIMDILKAFSLGNPAI